jgi:hypothetical protein
LSERLAHIAAGDKSSEAISSLVLSPNGFITISARDALFQGANESVFREAAKLLSLFARPDGKPWLTVAGRGAFQLAQAAREVVPSAALYRAIKFTESPFHQIAQRNGRFNRSVVLAPSADEARNFTPDILYFIGDSEGFHTLGLNQKVKTAVSLLLTLSTDYDALLRGYSDGDPMPGFSSRVIRYADFDKFLVSLPAVREAFAEAA